MVLTSLVIPWRDLLDDAYLAKHGVKTQGTVLDNKEVKCNAGKWKGEIVRCFYPVISFQTTSGNEIKFVNKYYYLNKIKYTKGQQIEVIYDPNKPSQAQANQYNEISKSLLQRWFNNMKLEVFFW